RRSPALNPHRYGAPRGTANLEGFLFPATYDLYRGTPASQLVSEQLLAFRERFGPELKRRARALGVSPYQLLTVASMIDRAARGRGGAPAAGAAERGGNLHPPATGDGAGDRRHDLLRAGAPQRARRLHARTDRSRPAHRLALQHPHPHGSAADPDIQPGHGLD